MLFAPLLCFRFAVGSELVGGEETVLSIPALVDDVHLLFVCIVEEEKVVAEELHLVDSFVHGHRLDRKALHAYRQLFFVILVVDIDVVC